MSSIDFSSSGLTLEACTAGSDTLLALYHDFAAGRLPQALLIVGEKGVGKRTLANLLAQGLMCRSEGKRPCGTCTHCKRFESRKHPDVILPKPPPDKKMIPVKDMREKYLSRLSQHPLEGGNRIMLIEEKMTEDAQDALLKPLEEPDEKTYFFIIAPSENVIKTTIRSRCRIVRMQPWNKDRLLKALLANNITGDEAHFLVAHCNGSIGSALEMHKDAAYRELSTLVINSLLSIRSTETMLTAATMLKEKKNEADLILNLYEQQIRLLLEARLSNSEAPDDLPAHWTQASVPSLRRLLEAVLVARRRKDAFVGWPSLLDGLMQSISEETRKWQV